MNFGEIPQIAWCAKLKQKHDGKQRASVLGPEFFSDCESPFDDILYSHRINFHTYADDPRLHTALQPASSEADALEHLEKCVGELRSCMAIISTLWQKKNDVMRS